MHVTLNRFEEPDYSHNFVNKKWIEAQMPHSQKILIHNYNAI